MQTIPDGTVVVYSEHCLKERCTQAGHPDWQREGVIEGYSADMPQVRWSNGPNYAQAVHPMNIVPKSQRPGATFDALRLAAIAETVESLNDQEKELAREAIAIIRPEFDKAKAAKDERRMKELIFAVPGEGLCHVERCFLLDEMQQALGTQG